jgi:hypothetical protein
VRLAADSQLSRWVAGIGNIPANLILAIANAPAVEVAAIQAFTDITLYEGNWWVYTPTNILGWDPGDPTWLKNLVNMLLPFPALSVPLGNMLNIVMAAEDPMHEGCTGIPGPCTDPLEFLRSQLRVPIWQLISGYTFPENPGGSVPDVPWAGTTVRLDLLAPITSVLDYLTSPPSGVVMPFDPLTAVKAVADLIGALASTLNPFVPGSYLLNPCGNGCGSFIPPTATSIPSFTPNAASTVTLDPAAHSPGGEVAQKMTTDKELPSVNVQRDSHIGAAGTGPRRPSIAERLDVARTSEEPAADGATGQNAVADGAGDRPNSTTPSQKPAATINDMASGNMAKPHRVTGSAGRGGPAGAAEPAGDRIGSAISNGGSGFNAGDSATGAAGTGGGSGG